MIKFLTSDLGTYKKINGEWIAQEINNKGLVVQVNKYLKNNNSILFIAADKSDFEKIDMYSSLLFKSLKLSGIAFKEYNVLDARTISKAKEFVEKASFIFLVEEIHIYKMNFFKKYILKDY